MAPRAAPSRSPGEPHPPYPLSQVVRPQRWPESAPWGLLTILFAASGCSALVYEIVWFQWLELIVGSSAVSLGILLAAFMGGMGLGSLWLSARFRASHPLRVYAWIELGIAVLAILIGLGLPLFRALYAAAGGSGPWGMGLRAAIAGVTLLPPTMLMGAALPVAARLAPRTRTGLGWVGWLYAANTFGAVAGCLLSGFYLLRVHDMRFATLFAVGLNVAVAGASLVASRRLAPPKREAPPVRPVARGIAPAPASPARVSGVHVAVLLSGCCALGAEVVWTRQLSLLLGATVYTFSIILAVMLLGLAIGGGAGAVLVQLDAAARRNLGLVQLAAVGATFWASWQINASLPYWPIAPALSLSPWTNFQLDLVRVLWALLPAATLWGASVPLAIGASRQGEDPSRHTALTYAANTAGAISGALVFTFVLIPLGGTTAGSVATLWLSFAAAIVALLPKLLAPSPARTRLAYAGLLLVALPATAVLARKTPAVPGELIAFGRSLAYRMGLQDPRTGARVPLPRVLYTGEGLNESVAVTTDEQVRLFHVSGKIEASTAPKDMRLQRMLGSLPALVHPGPRSVLVVGFGAGVTAGTFLDYPSVQRVVICELEPLIPQHVGPYFAAENHRVATDPRVTIVHDDAHHFMLTSKERFDVITSDPIHPWVRGSAVLYSREYFELARARLAPGGLVTQWVPLYQSSEATIREELATFMTAFPGATVWANRDRSQGYDLVLLGGAAPTRIALDGLSERWNAPDHDAARRVLAAAGFADWSDLLATYAGRQSDLTPWLAGAEINEDRSLHLMYQAGLESLIEQEGDIYARMSQYRAFPQDLFVGTPENVERVVAKGAE